MEVEDFAVRFDDGSNTIGDRCGSLSIEQHTAGVAKQSPRPPTDENRPDHTHHRVHPHQAKVLAGEQGHDRRDRSERVGQDVEIGRPKVVVMVFVLMLMLVVV